MIDVFRPSNAVRPRRPGVREGGIGLVGMAAALAALIAPGTAEAAGGCGTFLWQTSIGYSACDNLASGLFTYGMLVQNNHGSAVTISVQIGYEKDSRGISALPAKPATVPVGRSSPYNVGPPGIICQPGHKYRGWARVKLSGSPNWGSWAPAVQVTCT